MTSSGTLDVTAVVCTHQMLRYPQLLACLESLHAQTRPPQEIIVVVDGCPEVAEALTGRGGPETVVALPENVGLSAARNAGVQRVSTEWVAFLDDDAIAEETWLERLQAACREMGTVGAGGWSAPLFDGSEPSWLPPELLWTVGCSYRGMPSVRTLIRNVFGGCALLRRDLFDLVGGFDVDLGRRGTGTDGGEEAEFCLRVTAADPAARFAHVPDAVIRHRVGEERARPRYVLARCYSDGKSKGVIARSRGLRALGAESSFLLRVVPSGIVACLRTGRVSTAAALLAGVAAASLGYLQSRVTGVFAGPLSTSPVTSSRQLCGS